MGTDVFDPDNDEKLDFCRDVLGMETPAPEAPQAELLNGNSVLLLVYGFLMGLVIGFSLGAFAKTALFSGR